MKSKAFKYFSLLYDSIPFPIQIILADGSVVFVNKAFISVWGFGIDELKEYNLFDDPGLKKINISLKISEVLKKKSELFINNFSDSLLKSKASTLPFLRTKIFSLEIDGESFAVLFHEDQTEIILTEAEVRKARDGNKEAERLKNTFLNVLSHELRTPLNIVLGYSSIIKDSMRDKINVEDRIYLDNLYSGSERLFKSITQMLEFAQIEAGIYKLNVETFDLSVVLKSSISVVKEYANEKKLNIKTRFISCPINVSADIQSTENAINILLNNAVKFTKQGFIEVELNVLEDRELAICKIKDTGVGISAEYLDHLFRPFSQEDLNIGRSYEGNGLGLALAKRYIEKMGGSLLVDSIKGVGSTFTFTLPLAQNNTKNDNTIVLKKDNRKKILMLDSSRETLGLLNAFLKSTYNIKPFSYTSFDPAIVRSDNYEMIIFDVDQNLWQEGIIYCRQIKELTDKPILIISSEFLEDKARNFFDAGADKFLMKPFSKTELLNAIYELGPIIH
ncbi:MAG: ATP-binding protein [Ignavibacteriaceae bacterium]|nr:ATP-binding protein [Ignavibacteriaceae bacterium]